MLQCKHSALDRMLFALNLLLVLVNGYDCGDLVNNECNEGDSSSLSVYASCMV